MYTVMKKKCTKLWDCELLNTTSNASFKMQIRFCRVIMKLIIYLKKTT